VKRKLVLFDIDGTLLLSAGAGRRAIHAALGERGVDLAPASGIRFDGKTSCSMPPEIPRRTIRSAWPSCSSSTSPIWLATWPNRGTVPR
jgi:hypothetical protein